MIYFDTDVLVHFVVIQDEKRHQQAKTAIFSAIENSQFALSTLAIQEWLFVMQKLHRNSDL